MKAADAPLFEIRNLSIDFEGEGPGEGVRAVNDLSLHVDHGEIVGLIGQSGSGKTTLATGVLGLLRGVPGIVQGGAFFEGEPLQQGLLRAARGREIAVIFQEPRAALDPYFKIGEHMREALRRSSASLKESELFLRGVELLQDVGLTDAERLWSTYPHEVSGGMAQRVMIAMALCARPKLLVADEPSTALDVTTQAKLLELLRRLRDKHGLSILLISHDIGVIREVCRRVYVLHRGIVVEQGETAQVLRQSQHPYTISLVQAFSHFGANPAIESQGSDTPNAIVEVKGIQKRFYRDGKSFQALDDVSLTLREGETHALVGESGSGKSTLALSLMALQSVDSGEILYRGEDLLRAGKARMRNLRREIRMLFQHPEAVLNGGMTVEAILSEGLELEKGLSREEIRSRVLEALEQVRLDPGHALRYPGNLSSGEKQRVTIARALMTRPKVLVCDEPVASLDLAIQSQILELLQDFQQRLGFTYLFISHNLGLVKLLAHRIGVMYMGRLIEEAPVGNFTVDKVRHPYTRLLLASVPSMGDPALQQICAEFPDVEPVRLEGGCPFRNRCPWYLKNGYRDCETIVPQLRDMPGGGKAACHHVEDAQV